MTATIRRVLLCAASFAVWGAASAAGEPPSDDQIAGWIEALGSPQFSRREAATRSLVAAGAASLPSLREAMRRGDLEVSSRAIEVARGILGGGDPDAATAAERFLETVAEGDDAAIARLAGDTLDFHALGMADDAREKLKSLGMDLTPGLVVTGERGWHAKFSAAWRGTSDDLRLLLRVPGILIVSLHGVKIKDADLAILGRLRQASRIELYGTGIDGKQAAALAAKLPDARIEVRRGGKLGVAGQPNIGPCLITEVVPDSAADKAGLLPGDVVTKVDGHEVGNFEDLTDRIGSKGPGEKLELEISRGPPTGPQEHFVRSVELDGW